MWPGSLESHETIFSYKKITIVHMVVIDKYSIGLKLCVCVCVYVHVCVSACVHAYMCVCICILCVRTCVNCKCLHLHASG